MILLDTNVLSAVMQADPPEVVIAWLNRQPARAVWTTVITVFEIEYGLQRLPEGAKRTRLEQAFQSILIEELGGRILTLDSEAALAAGAIAASMAAKGTTPDFRDALIAGISLSRGARLATRNVKHFAGACPVVNPWEADTERA